MPVTLNMTIDNVTDHLSGHFRRLFSDQGVAISYETALAHFQKAGFELMRNTFEQNRWRFLRQHPELKSQMPPRLSRGGRPPSRPVPSVKKDEEELHLTPTPEKVGHLSQIAETQRNELAIDLLKLLLKDLDLSTASREARANAPMHYALFAKDCADCMLAVLDQTPTTN